MPSAYSFMFPAHIRFGTGVARSAGTWIRSSFWVNRALIFTDQGVCNAGLLEPVKASLDEADIPFDVCADITPNPEDTLIEEMAGRYRSDGHDVLVAVGGGSVIDAAKGAQVRITHPGHIRDYLEDGVSARKIIPNMPRLTAIPTTAGTGSEVTSVSVITDTRDRIKKGIASPYLRPALALVDPELMIGLPPAITAATGMDALTHCIEAGASKSYGPIGKAIALGGVELVAGALERAYRDGKDTEARTDMAMAAIMGGMAFGCGGGLGAAHALAHQLSTECGLAHGLANALLLPAVMAFNAETHPGPYVAIARSLGARVEGMEDREAAQAGIEAVKTLLRALDIVPSLAEAGVREEQIERMARQAMRDACARRNPRPCSEEDMIALYRAAW